MKPRPDRTVERRKEAWLRNSQWGLYTPKQQLALLDNRLGNGDGAKRQRARLAAIITTNA